MQAHALAFCRAVCFAFFLFSVAWASATAAQDRHAILVGVSGYPYLSEDARLNVGSELDPTKDGPANDVLTMKSTLLQRGFPSDNIVVLADGVSNTPLPTRANIISAFEATADKLVAGQDDYVFVFLAGHGSQQPARASRTDSEPDMLDETFLPYDVQPWDTEGELMPNALLDDEIGSLLAGLRNKGAFVWMVADTCHSATITRSNLEHLGDEVKFRSIDLQSNAGSPAHSVANSPGKVALVDPVALEEDAGGFVGFFAAQAHQSAPQARLPKNSEDQKTRGWFSYAFNTVLSEEPDLTYGQLSQRILDVYNAEYISRFVTPYYENIDQFKGVAAFANTSGDRQMQWQVRKDFDGNLMLAAGLLHGIGKGTKLAVFPTAAAGEDERLGLVDVTHVKATEAKVERVHGHEGDEPGMPARAWARLVEHEPALGLRVTLQSASGASLPDTDEIAEILRETASEQRIIRFLENDQPSDVTLVLHRDHLEFRLNPTDRTGHAVQGKAVPPLVTPFHGQPELQQAIEDRLTKVYKTSLLMKAADVISEDPALGGVELNMSLCAKASPSCVDYPERAQIRQPPSLSPGDMLQLSVANTEFELIDYTVLHIDTDFAIAAVSQGRLTKGDDPQRIMQGKITPGQSGIQQLMVILVEGRPGEEISGFSFFQDPKTYLWARDTAPTIRGRARELEVAERAQIAVYQWLNSVN